MRRGIILLAAVVAMLLLAGGVALGMILLRGTDEGDALNGSEGSDVVHGYGGNDTILGMAGSDVLFGGSGNDGMDSTPSAPEGVEAPGRDVYVGGEGDDTIASLADGVTETGRVRDHVRDYVFCGGGDDTVYADETDFVSSDCERVGGEA